MYLVSSCFHASQSLDNQIIIYEEIFHSIQLHEQWNDRLNVTIILNLTEEQTASISAVITAIAEAMDIEAKKSIRIGTMNII